jgi:glycosyltransferase involved in cell wall biosynthesis
MQKKMDISIVIPVYNEAENISQLYEEIIKAMAPLEKSFEIIFIDDGSTDNTFSVLQDIYKKAEGTGVNLVCIQLEYNTGKSAGLQIGFKEARGDIILTMDGDLQDDPSEIHKFIEKIDDGYDLVSGWKFKRRDPFTKIIPSRIFNIITSWLTGIKIHDFNCCFKAYHRRVIKGLDIYGDLYRFIPALVFHKGFKIAEIKVNHRPRMHGKSKYGSRRFLQGFFDLLTIIFLTKFTKKPLHFFGNLGLLSSFGGFFIVGFLYVRKFISGTPIGKNQFLFLLGILLVIVGFQFFSIGLLGELMVSLNPEGRKRYHIRERLQTQKG